MEQQQERVGHKAEEEAAGGVIPVSIKSLPIAGQRINVAITDIKRALNHPARNRNKRSLLLMAMPDSCLIKNAE